MRVVRKQDVDEPFRAELGEEMYKMIDRPSELGGPSTRSYMQSYLLARAHQLTFTRILRRLTTASPAARTCRSTGAASMLSRVWRCLSCREKYTRSGMPKRTEISNSLLYLHLPGCRPTLTQPSCHRRQKIPPLNSVDPQTRGGRGTGGPAAARPCRSCCAGHRYLVSFAR